MQEHALFGLDGSMWYFEARDDKTYNCASVWCAQALEGMKKHMLAQKIPIYNKVKPKPFLDACQSLASAAGLNLYELPEEEGNLAEPTPSSAGE